jgi:hypothetical protein
MIGHSCKGRDRAAERREQLRYQILERVYLLTGSCTDRVAAKSELESELGFSLDGLATVVDDLERLGYLARDEAGSRLCITDHGVEYLRQGAWRRRSIRD